MQPSWFLRCLGIFLIVVCSSSANDERVNTNRKLPIRRTAKPLNVMLPIAKIGEKLNTVLEKGVNLTVILDPLVSCFMAISPPENAQSFSAWPFDLHQEIKLQVNKKNFETIIPKAGFTDYCKSEDFEKIHNFLWVDDLQFKDLVKFFYRHGYPEIYNNSRALYGFYECPKELIDTIPTGPDAAIRAVSQLKSDSANIRNQILSSTSEESKNLLQLPEQCDIMEILIGFIKSGLVELLQLVETILDQIVADPSMQFLIGKISEPIKGQSFTKFRELTPVRKLFVYLHDEIVKNSFVESVLGLVEVLTGLDLKLTNLIETILNILQALLWQNFVPIPPYEP